MAKATITQEVRYPDSILTDDRGMIRLRDLNPQARIKVHGHYIMAKKIPLSIYTLSCGHKEQGIAVTVKELIFCESCQDTKEVVLARS